MNPHRSVALLLFTLLPGSAATAEPAPRQEPGTLEAGLAAVRPARIAADLAFVASDALGGRDTPSPGLAACGLFLRGRLERLGIAPGTPDGYFHHYALRRRKLDVEASSLRITAPERERELEFGRDYWLDGMTQLFPSQSGGALVSVGRGRRSDWEDSEVRGRWGLLFDQRTSIRQARRRAAEAGAVGIAVVAAPGSTRDYAQRYARTAAFMRQGTYSYVPDESEEEATGLPLVLLSDTARDGLLAGVEVAGEEGYPPAGTELGIELFESRVPEPSRTLVRNVCGLWPGSDPKLREEVIVVSAHYDHVGTQGAKIFNGADDNGSGTCGLLALAEALRARGPMRRSLLLLWVCGEEKGLWGSAAWTRDVPLPEGYRVVGNFNMDMIGRTATDELYITPSREHDQYNPIARAAYRLAGEEGFAELQSQDQDWARSDHMNFSLHLDVPVAFLSAGEHPDYHQPTDTADKIDAEKLSRIVRLVLRILDEVQAADLAPFGD